MTVCWRRVRTNVVTKENRILICERRQWSVATLTVILYDCLDAQGRHFEHHLGLKLLVRKLLAFQCFHKETLSTYLSKRYFLTLLDKAQPALTHAWRSQTYMALFEVQSSFLFNVVQKISKWVKICKSFCKSFLSHFCGSQCIFLSLNTSVNCVCL